MSTETEEEDSRESVVQHVDTSSPHAPDWSERADLAREGDARVKSKPRSSSPASRADGEPVALAVDIEFPAPILFAGDVTGMSIDVAVAGVPGKLKLPEQHLATCGHCVSLRSPRVSGGDVPTHMVRHWGSPAVLQSDPLPAAWISAALLEFEGPFTPSENVEEAISGAMVQWEERLLAWLEALSGRLLSKLAHQNDQIPTSKPVWRILPNGQYELSQGGGSSTTLTMPEFAPVQRAALELACRRASEGDDLPVEYELLRAAQLYAHQGNTRGALIELVSAFEVACATHARTLGGIAIDKMSSARGLGKKMDVLEDHNGALRETEREAIHALGDARNDAVHEGHDSVPFRLREMADHVQELVRRLSPI